MSEIREKALQTLIEKNVNIRFLKFCFERRKGVRVYNYLRLEKEQLTKDEYFMFRELIIDGQEVHHN